MLKKIALLTPRGDMSSTQFKNYWRRNHGPLVSGSPGYSVFRGRYLQDHIVAPGPVGHDFRYDGMAELWVAGSKKIEDEFATSAVYLDRIRPDEVRFLDMEQSIAMSAEEVPIASGGGAIKLIILAARRPDLSRAAYFAHLRGRYAELLMQQDDFLRFVGGYAQNHVIEGSLVTLNGARVEDVLVDSIEALWFDNVAQVHAALETRGWQEVIQPEGARFMAKEQLVSFIAQEIVFFDDGIVVSPPRGPA